MSTSYSLLLCGLMFFLSTRTCSSRHLHINAKASEDINLHESPAVRMADPSKGGAVDKNGGYERSTTTYTPEKPIKNDAAQSPSPPVKVSWRVPREGVMEENTGFNADYVGPNTHPSSHN
ncbi:hypothetical protein Cni_G15786 [Canna indica]|uniref:Uncharacterized protein n=1 Tax=Canna indica TaxID=4628 RepID=A0AAQ3QG48_9LILI|nr:hypothetical protein Cni_G15786 [Canna indica]